MKIKSFLSIAAFAFMGFSGAASAVDYFPSLSDGGFTGGRTVETVGGVPVTFSDDYYFSLAAPADAQVTASNFKLVFGTTYANLSSASFSLFDGTQMLGTSHSFVQGADPVAYTGLAAGSYRINVNGVTSGQYGGQYSLSFTSAAPVPEPETVAMMLAGLGLLGAVGSRRRLA